MAQERIKISQLPEPDLPENARMVDHGSHVENEPTLVDGVAKERLPAGFDRTTITDSRRLSLGISDQEALCWKQSPKVWDQVGDNPLNLENWLDVTGGRVVMKDGQPVKNGDLWLCAYPASQEKEFAAQKDRDLEQFLYNIEEGDVQTAEGGTIPRWRDRTQEELKEMRQAEHEASLNAGFVGEFAGMSWQSVLQNLGPEAWEKMADYHRGGPSSADFYDLVENEDGSFSPEGEPKVRNARDRRQEPQRGAGGKFISIPNNVRPKNIMGAKR